MDGPNNLRLKRRRNELPPDQLFVERGERKLAGPADEGVRYVLQPRDSAPSPKKSKNADHEPNDAQAKWEQPDLGARREYHLQFNKAPSKSGKRKQRDEDLATVVEKKQRQVGDVNAANSQHEYDEKVEISAPAAPLKRPGRGSALRPRGDKPKPDGPKDESIIARQQRDVARMAQEMHQFALDELAKTPKPEVTSKPKLPPSRARALHQANSPAKAAPKPTEKHDDTAMDVDSDSEYVYDTYVLAPTSLPAPSSTSQTLPATVPISTPTPSGPKIGYIIITEADEQAWETYMHDLPLSASEESDSDDSNAEDYYGADYPSDELASDDEHDRGAYGYRARRGSNDEQYGLDGEGDDDDDDEITWSDEEDMRMMNPFKARDARVERRLAKFLNAKREAGSGDEL